MTLSSPSRTEPGHDLECWEGECFKVALPPGGEGERRGQLPPGGGPMTTGPGPPSVSFQVLVLNAIDPPNAAFSKDSEKKESLSQAHVCDTVFPVSQPGTCLASCLRSSPAPRNRQESHTVATLFTQLSLHAGSLRVERQHTYDPTHTLTT